MTELQGRIFGGEAVIFARVDCRRRQIVLAKRGPIRFVIDTGFNGGLMVPAKVIAQLKFPVLGTEGFTLADGQKVPLPYSVGAIRVGPRTYPAECVPGDGLIGMEFLEMAFDSLHLDLRRGRFALRPRHTAK